MRTAGQRPKRLPTARVGHIEITFFGEFKEARDDFRDLGPLQTNPKETSRFRDDEEIDYCIVRVGSAGGELQQSLANAGFHVVGLEAGPFLGYRAPIWVSDEKGSHKLYWNDLRITAGTDPLRLGENNSGKGVGGGSVHWATFKPRFHPSDFRVYTQDGVGADWPISYEELKPQLRTAGTRDPGSWSSLLSMG
jgi:choline dehydrogenase-like flavoprotein